MEGKLFGVSREGGRKEGFTVAVIQLRRIQVLDLRTASTKYDERLRVGVIECLDNDSGLAQVAEREASTYLETGIQ